MPQTQVDPDALYKEITSRKSSAPAAAPDPDSLYADIMKRSNTVGDKQPPTPEPGHRFMPSDSAIRPPLTVTERARNFANDRVQNLPMLGTVVGGMFGGIPGAGLGAAAGAALRRANQVGIPNTGKGALEAGAEVLERGAEGAALEAGGKAVAKGLGELIEPGLATRMKSWFVRSPEAKVTSALKPSDLEFQKHLPKALDELKAAEAKLGEAKSIPDYRKALKFQRVRNSADIDRIVKPQAHITVPGSAKRVRGAQIAALPRDLDAATRKKLISQIIARSPKDYTIGELNQLRSELSGTQSRFYGMDTSGQLTMDAGTRAIDIARGESVRNQFYDALDKHGMGGSDAVRELNSRIGSIIHMDDALHAKWNTSVAQDRPPITYGAGKLVRPLKTTERFLKGQDATVLQDMKSALKQWKSSAQPVDTSIRLRKALPPGPTILGSGPDQSAVGTSAAPTQFDAQGRPILHGSQDFLKRGKGTGDVGPEPTKGQMDLLTTEHGGGAMAPPSLFGVEQTVPRWEPAKRETYTMQDLQEMLREIEQHISKTGGGKQRQELIQDTVNLRREINRRQMAQKAGGK